jgi:hypothetical protein
MNSTRKLTCLIVCSLLFSAISQSTTLLIPERQGSPGAVVRVDLAVNGADSLSGLEAVLQYDPTFLEFIQVEREGLAHDFIIVDKEKSNEIALVMARPEAIGKTYALLCGLTFRIRQSAQIGNATEITWRSSKLYSASTSPLAHTVEHGVVRVRDVSFYPNPFTPDGNGINDVVYFNLPAEMMSNAVVKIFGLGGDLIRELYSQNGAYLQWDGKNSEQSICKPGVYLYLLLINGESFRKGTITLML